jgi:hypothetical protein
MHINSYIYIYLLRYPIRYEELLHCHQGRASLSTQKRVTLVKNTRSERMAPSNKYHIGVRRTHKLQQECFRSDFGSITFLNFGLGNEAETKHKLDKNAGTNIYKTIQGKIYTTQHRDIYIQHNTGT